MRRCVIFRFEEYQLAGNGNTYWTKVGAAFAHNGKSGLNIMITPGISVSGKLVLLEPKDDAAPQAAPVS
ncbi:hypothetical protein EWM60_03740 [Candidatus Erwinia dacicola]|nr:hypothetical protein [Candidatus Erwinia dacicola]